MRKRGSIETQAQSYDGVQLKRDCETNDVWLRRSSIEAESGSARMLGQADHLGVFVVTASCADWSTRMKLIGCGMVLARIYFGEGREE